MIKSPEMKNPVRLAYYLLCSIERFVRSLAVIAKAASASHVFLQRVTFPMGLDGILKRVNTNIIFDIDDAIFLPDVEGNDLITRLKKRIKENEVKSILEKSKCVIVENDYIKEFVSKICSDIYKIPGPIDTDRYFVKPKEKTDKILIGWIGSPATTPYLNMINNVLSNMLGTRRNVSVRLIGAGNYSLPERKIDKISWSYQTEIGELQKFDIGIMPMPDNEWTRGKLGCKMLQYMALGIPTVASDTVTNREIMINGENGFLAKNEQEWEASLNKLIDSYELRLEMGNKARKAIEEKCSLKKNFDILIDILNKTKSQRLK